MHAMITAIICPTTRVSMYTLGHPRPRISRVQPLRCTPCACTCILTASPTSCWVVTGVWQATTAAKRHVCQRQLHQPSPSLHSLLCGCELQEGLLSLLPVCHSLLAQLLRQPVGAPVQALARERVGWHDLPRPVLDLLQPQRLHHACAPGRTGCVAITGEHSWWALCIVDIDRGGVHDPTSRYCSVPC
jgi:hypothetical protein